MCTQDRRARRKKREKERRNEPWYTFGLADIGGDIVTTLPKFCLAMYGKHARVMRNVPRTFICVIRSNFFGGVSTMSCHHKADALLIKISTLPNSEMTAFTHASIFSSSLRSTLKGKAHSSVSKFVYDFFRDSQDSAGQGGMRFRRFRSDNDMCA